MSGPRPWFIITPGRDQPSCPCPYCGAKLDAVTGVTGVDRPQPGDPSICAYCAGLLVFALDGTVREPDEHELAVLINHQQLMVAQRAVRSLPRQPPQEAP
jgi:hypothetical protein